MDYISGNKLKELAKWQYAPERGQGVSTKNTFPKNDYRYIENTLDKSSVRDGDMIYTPTFYADSLLDELGDFDKRVVILTHNADNNMQFTPPDYVIKWYSQNVNVVHDRVFSVPIGLENDFWIGNKVLLMEAKMREQRGYRNLIYVNHNVATNPRERQRPYDLLRYVAWATCEAGVNGSDFSSYINNLYSHPFMVVPAGNGIDTHRLWECLYMGTIPVVIKNINNSFYSGLPILYLDEWDQLTEKFLLDSYANITGKEWNMERIYFKYWKNELSNYIVSH